jgi:acetyl-CoA acyltransferase
MREIAIVSSVRTAVGKSKRGNLKDTRPDDLMGIALKGAMEAAGIDPADLDDVVVGTAFPEAEQGMNVARTAGFRAGIPAYVPAMTVNRFCSSGLQSIAQAASAIMAGWQDIVVAGGVESMTQIPMGGQKPSPNPTIMTEDPALYTPMGITAEIVAERFNVTREEQDAFSLRSHEKALAAQADGKFDDEIIPVATRVYKNGEWKDIVVDKDEGPRGGSTMEGLAKLKPPFKLGGTVTAASSSQVSDGAAAAVITTKEIAEEKGLPILALLKSYQVVGVDPSIMGVGPLYAVPKAVEAAGLQFSDIGLYEINEAFASQAIYCVRELGIDAELVNVNGGAVALGHPLGCTGARIMATLLHEMKRRGVKYGIAAMCIGGGMGAAAVFENPNA